MKKILFVSIIEARLLIYDVEKLIEKALWFAKKTITPIVLGFGFWVAFQIITAFSR